MPLNAGASGTLRLKVMLRLPEPKPSSHQHAPHARLPLPLPLPGFAGYHTCAVCRAPAAAAAAAAASVVAAPADNAAHDRKKREEDRQLRTLRDQVRALEGRLTAAARTSGTAGLQALLMGAPFLLLHTPPPPQAASASALSDVRELHDEAASSLRPHRVWYSAATHELCWAPSATKPNKAKKAGGGGGGGSEGRLAVGAVQAVQSVMYSGGGGGTASAELPLPPPSSPSRALGWVCGSSSTYPPLSPRAAAPTDGTNSLTLPSEPYPNPSPTLP